MTGDRCAGEINGRYSDGGRATLRIRRMDVHYRRARSCLDRNSIHWRNKSVPWIGKRAGSDGLTVRYYSRGNCQIESNPLFLYLQRNEENRLCVQKSDGAQVLRKRKTSAIVVKSGWSSTRKACCYSPPYLRMTVTVTRPPLVIAYGSERFPRQCRRRRRG